MLRRQHEANSILTARELKEQNNNIHGNVSLHTVQDTLQRDLGFKCFYARKKPLVYDRQRKNKFRFAKKYRDWSLASGVL